MINKAIIQGRFVREPEVKKTKAGKNLCNFTIAWSTKIGEKETKLFLKCIAWNRTADNVAKWFHKGQEAIVSGQLETNSWQDKEGNNRYEIQMVVSEVHFCGPKTEFLDTSEYKNDTSGSDFEEADDLPDDLPW